VGGRHGNKEKDKVLGHRVQSMVIAKLEKVRKVPLGV
jgi:hypothetical protein